MSKETKDQIVSRTERTIRDPKLPMVYKKIFEAWVLREPEGTERVFLKEAPLGFEQGDEDDVYDCAAHILLSHKHFRWYEDYAQKEFWERRKLRLARWLKWHDTIRRKYLSE